MLARIRVPNPQDSGGAQEMAHAGAWEGLGYLLELGLGLVGCDVVPEMALRAPQGAAGPGKEGRPRGAGVQGSSTRVHPAGVPSSAL